MIIIFIASISIFSLRFCCFCLACRLVRAIGLNCAIKILLLFHYTNAMTWSTRTARKIAKQLEEFLSIVCLIRCSVRESVRVCICALLTIYAEWFAPNSQPHDVNEPSANCKTHFNFELGKLILWIWLCLIEKKAMKKKINQIKQSNICIIWTLHNQSPSTAHKTSMGHSPIGRRKEKENGRECAAAR